MSSKRVLLVRYFCALGGSDEVVAALERDMDLGDNVTTCWPVFWHSSLG